ncbi:hypothetical protein C8R47DRAFT_1240485 [Mycena vitilis]|nr:hypothetical protein C8R47DRAFT_1240485 [Mycena vitilis]
MSDDDSSDVELVDPKMAKKKQRQSVNWKANDQWTDMAVEYLLDNPEFRRKLFSDSTAEAKKENRKKSVAKDGKAVQYAQLAKFIFEEDPKEQARYANDPAKQQYRVSDWQIRDDWPWWDNLHAFWRELPSYNPIGVQSSEPGTDHASAAVGIFDQSAAASDVDVDGEPLKEDTDNEDGHSEASIQMARERSSDKAYEASSDSEDGNESITGVSSRPSKRSPSRSASPPLAVVKKTPRAEPKGKGKAVAGRDLGLAKANAPGVPKKKPQNAIDRMNNIREIESSRLAEKRRFMHKEQMSRSEAKLLKYQLKLAQAENERLRLNRRATSQSPRRRERVLHFGSPSPSKARSSRYSAASPRHVEFHHTRGPSLAMPTFGGDDYGRSEGGSAGAEEDIQDAAHAPDWEERHIG